MDLTRGENIVDVASWAGPVPAVSGTAPPVRVGRSRWFNLLWLVRSASLLIAGVALATELRSPPTVESFINQYPGTVTPATGNRAFKLGGLPSIVTTMLYRVTIDRGTI